MNRFRALDIARGVAILGTLGTNIWIFTQTMEMTWLSALSNALTNGKFLGLLTLMFGIGMQLKHDSLQRRGLPWRRIYIWSMILLFLDGLLHYVFVFEFDVLMSYALVGIMASFLMTRPKKSDRSDSPPFARHSRIFSIRTEPLVKRRRRTTAHGERRASDE